MINDAPSSPAIHCQGDGLRTVMETEDRDQPMPATTAASSSSSMLDGFRIMCVHDAVLAGVIPPRPARAVPTVGRTPADNAQEDDEARRSKKDGRGGGR